MRISLGVCVSIALVFICSVNTSFSASPEDFEGSGNDLDDSASGSGDWSEGENDDINDVWAYGKNTEDDTENPSDGSSIIIYDKTQWPSEDSYVILANRKTLLENKEVLDGVIAGAVTGVILAVTVAAILIYKWHKKDTEGYIQGQRSAPGEDYLRQSRDEVIVV